MLEQGQERPEGLKGIEVTRNRRIGVCRPDGPSPSSPGARDYRFRPGRARAGPWEHVVGDVQDVESLASSLAEKDALVYMAMNTQKDPGSAPTVANAFDVNVKGLYFAFLTARDNGVPHGVYASSMSVFSERDGLYPDESVAPDATDYYGLTKRLGEEVCKALVADGGITITALRLCFPVDDDAPPPPIPISVRPPSPGLRTSPPPSLLRSSIGTALTFSR